MKLEEGQTILKEFFDSYGSVVPLDKRYDIPTTSLMSTNWPKVHKAVDKAMERNAIVGKEWRRRTEHHAAKYREIEDEINKDISNDFDRRTALLEHKSNYPRMQIPDHSNALVTYLLTNNIWKVPLSVGHIAAPVQHSFCVADYEPDANSPTCVQEMANFDFGPELIIDPWMNIVCEFSMYPLEMKMKLCVWDGKGKIISKSNSGFLRPTSFIPSFLTARLRFFRHLDASSYFSFGLKE